MKFNSLLNDVLGVTEKKYKKDKKYDKREKYAKYDKYDKKKKYKDHSYEKQSSAYPVSQHHSSGTAGALSNVLGKNVNAGTILKLGSAAALGALAYHAYQKYTADKPTTENNQSNHSSPQSLPNTAFQPNLDESASRIILRTMIAAASVDGEIDAQERALIQQESSDDLATQAWLIQELNRPATVAELAHEIGGNMALAMEAYLVARLVCGTLSRKEMVFLAQLSHALNLDNQLVEQLEKQAELSHLSTETTGALS